MSRAVVLFFALGLGVAGAFLVLGILRALEVRFPTGGLVTWRGKPVKTEHPKDGWGGIL